MAIQEKKLTLFHPFSPTAVGLDEATIPQIHSQPHIAALRNLCERGWTCYADYLSVHRLPYQKYDGKINWRFWPVSRTWNNKKRKLNFRTETSYWALSCIGLNPPDVLVLNMSAHTSLMTRTLAKIAHQRKKKYIAMLGGINYTESKEVVDYYINADAVIVHTNWQRQLMLSMPHYSKLEISVLPLGVDCERFHPVSDNPQKLGDPGLLFVGRWQEIKGIHHAVKALKDIKSKFPKAKLHIIGPESDPVYARKIKQYVVDSELETSVVYHGLLSYDELPKYYQMADFLLLPTVPGLESFGMVVIESMACGTPVVALRADGGGPSEIITHNKDGLLVNSEEISNSIIMVYKNKSHFEEMCKNAHYKVNRTYSYQTTNTVLEKIIEQVTFQ